MPKVTKTAEHIAPQFLLFSCQGVVVALAVVRTLSRPGGGDTIHFVLVQIHHTVVLVVLLVIIEIPAGITLIFHVTPPE